LAASALDVVPADQPDQANATAFMNHALIAISAAGTCQIDNLGTGWIPRESSGVAKKTPKSRQPPDIRQRPPDKGLHTAERPKFHRIWRIPIKTWRGSYRAV